jgi:hypothetical protein
VRFFSSFCASTFFDGVQLLGHLFAASNQRAFLQRGKGGGQLSANRAVHVSKLVVHKVQRRVRQLGDNVVDSVQFNDGM